MVDQRKQTVGTQFNIVISSSQEGSVRGLPLLTLGTVFCLPEADLQHQKQLYQNSLNRHDTPANDLLSYGLILFRYQLYDQAQKLIEQSLEKEPGNAYAWYALSCSLLEGSRPRDLMARGKVIKPHDSAYTAYRLDPTKTHYTLLLAAIKEDFFEYKRYVIDSPSVDECLESASNGTTSLNELNTLLDIIKIPNGRTVQMLHKLKHQIV